VTGKSQDQNTPAKTENANAYSNPQDHESKSKKGCLTYLSILQAVNSMLDNPWNSELQAVYGKKGKEAKDQLRPVLTEKGQQQSGRLPGTFQVFFWCRFCFSASHDYFFMNSG
jgi:hypothetical protein